MGLGRRLKTRSPTSGPDDLLGFGCSPPPPRRPLFGPTGHIRGQRNASAFGVRLATPTAGRLVRFEWLRAAWCETFCHALCTIRDSWLCGFCSVRNRAESISALALTWRQPLHCAAEGVCPGQSSSRHKFGDHLCVGFPARKRRIVFCTLGVA